MFTGLNVVFRSTKLGCFGFKDVSILLGLQRFTSRESSLLVGARSFYLFRGHSFLPTMTTTEPAGPLSIPHVNTHEDAGAPSDALELTEHNRIAKHQPGGRCERQVGAISSEGLHDIVHIVETEGMQRMA
jgi:hypothetical protein